MNDWIKALRHSVILVIFVASIIPIFGQEVIDAKLEFEHIANGLSQNTVTCILQDRKGFMWFGTRNGLNRYDGVEFKEYHHKLNDSVSMSQGLVLSIYEDAAGTLWIGTRDGGLSKYLKTEDHFVNVKLKDKPYLLSNTPVTAIFEDSEGDFWIGTEKHGLVLFDRETNEATRYQHQASDAYSISNNHIQRIFEDHQGTLWVATAYHGLNMMDKQHQRFFKYSKEADDKTSLSDNAIWTVFKSGNGNIWIGTRNGLNLMYRNQMNQVKFQQFLPDITDPNSLSYHVIASLAEDGYGNLWIGTENGGLSIFDPRKQTFQRLYHNPRNPKSLGNNSVQYIYKDRTGAMWLAPLNSGINKYDARSTKFKHTSVKPYLQNTLSHNNVMCFLEDPKGNLWIGTDGGGLNYYDPVENHYKHYRHNPKDPNSIGSDAVLDLLYDDDNRLWISTWEGGLNLFNSDKGTFTQYQRDPKDSKSIRANSIHTMLYDSKGRLWLGAIRGTLELFDPNTGTFRHFQNNQYPNSSIYAIFEDRAGDMWVGYQAGGLSQFKFEDGQGSFTNFNYDQNQAPITVTNIYEDSFGNLWIGTEGAGLNLFDRDQQTFTSFNHTHGLPNDVIHDIQEDKQGFLWISTNRGISKFDPRQLTFRNYNQADGLQSDEFIRGSSYTTSDGKIMFGGINGFNYFYPEAIQDNQYIPPVYLTDFLINHQPVAIGTEESPLTVHIGETEKISLNHDQSIFTIGFAALNYTQGENNRYQYQLDGYDEHWQQVGSLRSATYTKVPPGQYVFRVKGSNNDGIWNEQEASISIRVNPPWWKSDVAQVLYICLFILALMGARQIVIHRERLKSRIQLEQLELKKMHEMDNLKSRFFANISHEFRTPLTLIKEPLKYMFKEGFMGNSKQQLRVMLRNTDKLLSLTNKLQDLSKLGAGSLKLRAFENDLPKFLKIISESFRSQAERQFLVFNFEDKGGPQRLYFDEEKLEDVLYNILSNAFKFTPEYGQIDLELDTVQNAEGDWAQITVRDNGIGIPEDQIENIFNRFYQADNQIRSSARGSGIGLALTRELVELHHGTISVQSREDQGTKVIIHLPCGCDHLDPKEIVKPQMVEITQEGKLKGLESAVDNQAVEIDLKDLPLILVVEDNDDMRAYISEYLETKHRVVEASNGEEALEMAIRLRPELIISDIRMPVMGGVELCKQLKQDDRTNHIPVMLLTGRVDEENEINGLAHGADYYFTKPFNSKLLQLTIHNIIQSREVLKNHYSGSQISLEPSRVSMSSGDEKFLKSALSCVEENISNPEFSVIELGKGVGLSRMQLYRKLKSVTGQSANEFIREIRLKRAAQLIEERHYTIAEITYEVGFNDLQYFRECFKKHFNVTPSKYLDYKNRS